jgi:glutathione synthase/RimK-type ligase-like ATP-grasp enzyme
MILIISYPGEEHTDVVVGHLERAGRDVVRLDMAEFPSSASLTLNWTEGVEPSFQIGRAGRVVEMAAARVGWWRRVRPFTIDPSLGGEMSAFAESETAQAVGGMLDALPCRWVNTRAADDAAHRKPYQWAVAQRLGIAVPRTLVTTDPDAARRFVAEAAPGHVVFKPFLASSTQSWRETRIVGQADLERLDLVRFAPVIFQHYVDGLDLRVTIVGEQVFAAEIDARGTRYPFDMRMVIGEALMRPVELPRAVRDALLALLRRLGLDYGAIDLRRTDDGRFFFLEVNPAGQWLFVEQRTGLRIGQAMAYLLAGLEDAELCPTS